MLEHYVPILLLLGMVLGFAVVNLVISDLLGGHRKVVSKGSAYECGMAPIGTARVRLSIHFYLVAVLFILFDVEAVFLVLWAVGAKSFAAADVGLLVFTEIVIFVGLLVLALAYVWKKGGLDWDR
ncbi:MAG: NADH-quinone oxidoreductase subunit A [Planctomycetota bacterium]|nr:NADH-quinone oxidoreductase subunit A [Planctomycetota bacterium]